MRQSFLLVISLIVTYPFAYAQQKPMIFLKRVGRLDGKYAVRFPFSGSFECTLASKNPSRTMAKQIFLFGSKGFPATGKRVLE